MSTEADVIDDALNGLKESLSSRFEYSLFPKKTTIYTIFDDKFIPYFAESLPNFLVPDEDKDMQMLNQTLLLSSIVDKFMLFLSQSFSIDQKTLFEKLPGIYYNVVCRSTCSDLSIPHVALRRMESNVGAVAYNTQRVNRPILIRRRGLPRRLDQLHHGQSPPLVTHGGRATRRCRSKQTGHKRHNRTRRNKN
jgi:hypothetical protein